MVFGPKVGIFFWFFKQIGQNEVFCVLLDSTLAILDLKTSILKSRKFAFFQRDKSIVFGQNLECLFLFSFLEKCFETENFVTF